MGVVGELGLSGGQEGGGGKIGWGKGRREGDSGWDRDRSGRGNREVYEDFGLNFIKLHSIPSNSSQFWGGMKNWVFERKWRNEFPPTEIPKQRNEFTQMLS